MIISFDIDNTLIPYSDEFEVENKTLSAKILRAESIRKGTIKLFKELEKRGHQIWIYTTSFRSEFYLKKTFKAYGMTPTKIINQKLNQVVLRKHNCSASKNPDLFGIDIHIDDSKGVGIEGAKFGFKTIIVAIDEVDWVEKILQKINVENREMLRSFK